MKFCIELQENSGEVEIELPVSLLAQLDLAAGDVVDVKALDGLRVIEKLRLPTTPQSDLHTSAGDIGEA